MRRHPSLIQSCCGIISPLWALGLFISVTLDIAVLERGMDQFVMPVENGMELLCSAKVTMTLIYTIKSNDAVLSNVDNRSQFACCN